MSHSTKALVLHCMDFRFVHSIVHFLKDAGYLNQYDDVSVAGAAKNLVDPVQPSDPELVLRQIEIAKRLHDIQEVIIINHRDCGAYGKGVFDNEQAEGERHWSDLQKAKDMILAKLPGIQVKTYLAKLTGEYKAEFESQV